MTPYFRPFAYARRVTDAGHRLAGKLSGNYTRGKTFWFTYRLNGKNHFHSLQTSDYGEAVKRALEIRQNPRLMPASAFADEIKAFIAHKLEKDRYSARSAATKIHALDAHG